MQYREYGSTGKKVSVLGFGAMRLPGVKKGPNELNIQIIRRSLDLGINYIDTAAMYGASEVIVGEAIKGYRDKVYISTKNHYKKNKGEEWRQLLDRSLEKMDIDYIDFYHLHSLKLDNYNKMLGSGKPVEEFKKAKEEGVIKHLCFSSHDKPKNIIKLIDTELFEGMLVQYNLLDRRNEEVIAYAREKNMGVAIMGPVGGGRLVGNPSERITGIVNEVKSTPEVALRFVLSNSNVTLALSGMNSIEMVEENIATASRKEPLSEDERQRILEVAEETLRLADLYCTGCGYCMPCPNDVDIPANFTAMNYYQIWGMKPHAKKLYKDLGKRKRKGETIKRWAEACIECGECEPKCPQNIPIREWLKETAEVLS